MNAKYLCLALMGFMGANLAWADKFSDDVEASTRGLYASLGGGITLMPELHNTTTYNRAFININEIFTPELGYTAQAAVGYRFNPNFRLEVAENYFYNRLDGRSYTGNATNTLHSGNVKAYATFLNGYYDFANETPFTPYVGLGAGYLHDDTEYETDIDYETGNYHYNYFYSIVAFQGIGGIDYNATDNLAVFGEYHHVYTPSKQVSIEPTSPGPTNDFTKTQYITNTIAVGLRYSF